MFCGEENFLPVDVVIRQCPLLIQSTALLKMGSSLTQLDKLSTKGEKLTMNVKPDFSTVTTPPKVQQSHIKWFIAPVRSLPVLVFVRICACAGVGHIRFSISFHQPFLLIVHYLFLVIVLVTQKRPCSVPWRPRLST